MVGPRRYQDAALHPGAPLYGVSATITSVALNRSVKPRTVLQWYARHPADKTPKTSPYPQTHQNLQTIALPPERSTLWRDATCLNWMNGSTRPTRPWGQEECAHTEAVAQAGGSVLLTPSSVVLFYTARLPLSNTSRRTEITRSTHTPRRAARREGDQPKHLSERRPRKEAPSLSRRSVRVEPQIQLRVKEQ